MPSHTPASALIGIYTLDGAPWEWPVWQERTGIRHGLFPKDDKHLPPGWTRKDAQAVESYFCSYNQLPTEHQKLQFAAKQGNAEHPGRNAWQSFVSRNWNRWGIHNVVVEELRALGVHPAVIISREESKKKTKNKALQQFTSDSYIPLILDSLGIRLFGEEALMENSDLIEMDIRRNLQMIAQRSWSIIRCHANKLKNKQNEIEEMARAAFADLKNGKLTKAKVTRAIRAVAKWKECAELLSNNEHIQKADGMLGELQVVMVSLGAEIPKEKKIEPSGSCKVSEKALRSLASEEDVSDLIGVFYEYFDASAEDDEEEQPIPDIFPEKKLNDEGGDFGMEVEHQMQPNHLSSRLGFRTGLPPQFNVYRHRSGTPWDDDTLFKADSSLGELSKMALHWHQLAGVHSIVRSIFTDIPEPDRPCGVLVGDEVGLGKTAQAITFIAFLNQAIWLQRDNRPLPDILIERPFLGTDSTIPSLPHLILCPGTLVSQWFTELRILLLPCSVDILVYDSQTNSKVFWGPDGPVISSKHESHNRIIIATHSVNPALFNDMKKSHRPPTRSRNARPWDVPSE
ncbi:hypothetical protein AN958_03743 [Leucoagaricus sp. SymC.cos]|nr:hypothetical protein AN958_03743 [Leucoagaricus sp. SymC.cos]